MINIKSYKMFNGDQQRIYDSLKNLGESLANFYMDAVRMISPECTLLSKAHLIAHAAREIDGGLRDVFAPKKILEREKVKNSKLINEGNSHFTSILTAIGKEDTNNALAKKWYGIATNFHRISHRNNIHEGSTNSGEIISLWHEYEKVLDIVIGSFLGLTNRLDVLIKMEEPDIKTLPVLHNILKNPQASFYFFSKLDKIGWLRVLRESGYFDFRRAPEVDEKIGLSSQWFPIKYLLNISNSLKRNSRLEVISIVEEILVNFIEGKILLHPFTAYELLKILSNIDDYSFTDKVKDFTLKFYSEGDNWGMNLIHRLFSDEFVRKLLAKKDKEGLERFLNYFFGFSTYEQNAISLFGEADSKPFIKHKPNVDEHFITEMINKNGKEIVALLQKKAISIPVKKLIDLDLLGPYSRIFGLPSAIEESPQNSFSDNWETSLINFIRDYSILLSERSLGELLDEMLISKIQIIQRIAIHIIRVNFEQFKSKWFEFIEVYNEGGMYIHEPYLLVQQHSSSFTNDEFAKTILWVENISHYEQELAEEKAIYWRAFKIRRWLTAFQPTSLQSKRLLQEKMEYYFNINDLSMTDHPEFDSYTSWNVRPEYPIKYNDFKSLSIQEKANFINGYKPSNDYDNSEEGLSTLLKSSVIENPEEYIYSLDTFSKLHSIYKCHLISGFTSALEENKSFDYSLLLDFIELGLNDKTSKCEREIRFYSHGWLASSAVDFIKTLASKYPELPLNVNVVNRLLDLVLDIINNNEYQEYDSEIRNGYINHVLNSVVGRSYLTIIDLCKVRNNYY